MRALEELADEGSKRTAAKASKKKKTAVGVETQPQTLEHTEEGTDENQFTQSEPVDKLREKLINFG